MRRSSSLMPIGYVILAHRPVKSNCHSERSEESLDFPRPKKLRRCFASLSMTAEFPALRAAHDRRLTSFAGAPYNIRFGLLLSATVGRNPTDSFCDLRASKASRL